MSSSLGLPPGFVHRYFDLIDSTNAEALRQAQSFLPQGRDQILVLQAGEQTAGRGRRGRAWTSPRGNLHLSLLFDPGRPLAEAAQLSFATAVALAEAVESLAPVKPACKWPNDLLLTGHKLSGILLEAQEGAMVVGVGVNIVAAPDPALYPATALDQHGFKGSDSDVMQAFLPRFAHWLGLWRAEGFAPLRTAWLARAHGLGGPVTVRLPADTLTGTFTGLDDQGALRLTCQDGNHKTIQAGDVFFGEGS